MKLYTTPLIGMLCSALVIGNSYAAGTFVASKSYVDNYVDNAVSPKQDKLGGGTNSGKVVTATATAGDVAYTEIESTPTAGSTKLVTSGGVQAAISDATSSQLKTSDKDSTNVVISTNTSKIPTVSTVQAGIAKQGDATADWTAVTDSTKGTSVHLVDAKTNQDNYIPTVKAVETRIKTTETELAKDISTNAAAITAEEERATTAEGQLNSKISTNSGLIAANTTSIGQNTSAIAIINGDASTAGSIKKAVADAVANKADKATTLAAYGITDAYTKSDVYTKSETNTELAKKEDKNNKVTSTDNWEPIANGTDKDTKYPTVAAVQEYASSTYLTQNLANVPDGNYGNINPGTGVAGNLVALDAAVSNIANNAAVKNAGLPVSASAKNSVVTYDAQGLVTGGFQLENGGIKSIENADSATLCSTTNPCILTYLGGTGATADYRWTPMDEGTETIPAKPAS